MSNPAVAGNHCVIVVADLFNKINAQRKLLTRTPIENQAMITRCTLRFNVDTQRNVDFSAEKIVIHPKEIEGLERMVNELFGVYFEGEVSRLCVKPKAPAPKPTSLDSFMPQSSTMATRAPEKAGLLSRLKGLFSGR